MFRNLLVVALLLSIAALANAQVRLTAQPLPAGATLSYAGLTPQVAPDYSNTTTPTGFYAPGGSGAIVADDVHRTTSLPIAQISFAYFAPTAAPNVTMYIYNNVGDFTLPAPLIASYNLGTLNGGGVWAYTITLPSPLTAPQDLWIGFSFSTSDAGLLIYHPPTIGTSHDLFTFNNTGPFWFGGNPPANFYLETVPVPEPASLLVLGSGVVGLLTWRRRRA
ncbi:MAG: PEP-CTERM sorting domain-containing protein [Armatimonadota bacterium]|nr:PEP-CTERM sorting domain-containing protein [Armatimonadota bacterium]